jgi:hypothetical protein
MLRTLAWWSIAIGVDAESVADRVKTASNATVGEESPALHLGRVLALRAIGQTVKDDVIQLMTQAATDQQLPESAATAIRDGAVNKLLSDRERESAPSAFRGGVCHLNLRHQALRRPPTTRCASSMDCRVD